MSRKNEITISIVDEIKNQIEKEFDTIINHVGVLKPGDKYFEALAKKLMFKQISTAGYIVVPTLLKDDFLLENIVLFNNYQEETRYIKSPTRILEVLYEFKRKEYDSKLKTISELVDYIDNIVNEGTTYILETSMKPYDESESKIINNFHLIEDAGYTMIGF